ncbi:MAG: heparinase II/III family protein, partial [Sphingomonadales bacterium]|nr:heparinase II/III family protein [Sphingomonadales bacterium]
AEKLMAEWLNHYSQWHKKAWRPDLIGSRLINWSLHAPLVLSTNDMVYRSLVLNCMAYQARHLAHVSLKGESGPRRIRTITGLIIAGHTMPNGGVWAKRGLNQLESQLNKLILADGGMATRNPHDLVHVARDLITLRAVMEWFSAEVPEWIQIAFDRLVPFVKSMAHGDHRLAHFNGAYEGREEDLDEILNLSRAKGRAISMAPHTGYQRLKRKRTLLLVDVGPPPREELSATCHLAPLAFELSDGKDRIVVNRGGTVRGHAQDIKAGYPNRHTASHSTLTINGSDAGTIGNRGDVTEGARAVVFERNENDDGLWLDGWHDAYVKNFGLSHQRRLFLSTDGGDLRGEDLLLPEKAGFFGTLRGKTPKPVEVRFHLHPMCNASHTMDMSGIIIRTPTGHGWLFRSKGGDITLEDDIYCQRPGEEQRTKMIVLKTEADNTGLKLNWSFKRMDP